MKDSDSKVPDQKELEKELNEYLGKKYGDRIRLVVPMLFPKPQAEEVSKEEKELGEGKKKIHFDLKPEELEAFLNDYIIRQDEAKEILATKICTHFNRIKFTEMTKGRNRYEGVGHIKNNILMIGPTGVGKTYLIKLIAKKIGVPFVKGDATKFSETGYVGGDVEDLVRDLVYEVNGDIELAQYGIIYVDEIDKIASSNNLIGPDVSRTGVQRALLKPMEETEVDLKVPHDPISQLEAIEHYRKTGKREKRTINTKNILFIMSGAFNGLEDLSKKRLNQEGIGFGAEIRSKDERAEYLKQVKAEDLMTFGFESEFIGRLPVTTVFEKLEVDDLYAILKNPNNPITLGKKKDFKSYGIDIQFEDEALYELAVKAHEEKTGARGLVSAVEKVLIKFEKRLPSTDIRKFVVTRAVVENPQRELERLLQDPSNPEMLGKFEALLSSEKMTLKESILRREAEFKKRYGIVFLEGRINLIVNRMIEKGYDVNTVSEEVVEIQQQVEEFEKDFQRRTGIDLEFSEEAINRITEIILNEEGKGTALFLRLSKDYEYGFELIRDKTGQREFIVTRETVDDPEGYLNRMIREIYKRQSDQRLEDKE
ncbi:MAG: ATPase [Deltaproteobacteria bacterium CG03_land_8_20_14_0_80_45_14]|nr:MAG: ATPase [Deltaproteobacteria bacterium CG03_land_8_20_14_0_80_45_14]